LVKVSVDVGFGVDVVLAAASDREAKRENSDDDDDDDDDENEKITMQKQQQRLTADLIQQQEEQLGNKNSNIGNSITSEMCTTTLPNNSQPVAPSLPLPPPPPLQQQQNCSHAPTKLPTFKDPRACMWTSSHAANAPSEDRSASLVNVLLQPLPHTNFDNETQIHDNFNNGEYHSLIRLNLWSVIDGHGGGCVATYASEVLLPHIAASISRALGCAIVNRGVCLVNGQLRDANALDLDGLIKSTGSDRSQSNSNSIHYRSPYERAITSTTDDSDNDKEDDDHHHHHHDKNDHHVTKVVEVKQKQPKQQKQQYEEIPSHNSAPSPASTSSHQHQQQQQQQQLDDANSIVAGTPPEASSSINQSGSFVKTSVKTAASLGVARDSTPLAGTHSPEEITAITQAITQSFLSVDEGWINSIDPVATHQTSCQSNGRWNSGACALTVFTVQRLEWTKVSLSEQGNNDDDDDGEHGRRGEGMDCDDDNGGHDTSQNKDAARRRMLDHNATRALKSASSLSTISSTSSLTTTDDRSGLESEITETEGEEDDSISFNGRDGTDKTKRSRRSNNPQHHSDRNISTDIHINVPGGCSCHCYRAYDAMLYTAHVGDCRAVMLGSAPPTMIKVHGDAAGATDTTGEGGGGPGNQTDDESSHHSSDETECLSSSDHDADSSDDEDVMMELEDHRQRRQHNNQNHHLDGATAVTNVTTGTSTTGNSYPYASYVRVGRPPRRQSSRRRRYDDLGMNQPFIALPPLEGFRSIEIEIDPDCKQRKHRHHRIHSSNSNSNNDNNESDNNNNNNSCGNGGTGGGSGNNNEEQSVASSSSSSSPSSQDSREFPPAIILPPATRPIDLTTDHSAYNPAEVTAVLRRCNNCPRAISSGMGGGIKRVAGSLAVTRALGDAYLKTPRLSFFPYKTHTPYITARPEVNCRHIVKGEGGDKVVVLATDGVWERAGGEDILRWVRTFYAERLAEAERRENKMGSHQAPGCNNNNNTNEDEDMVDSKHPPSQHEDETTAGTVVNRKRDAPTPPGTRNTGKRRKLTRRATPFGSRRNSTVAEVIVNRVLNKVRRARNIKSLHALMSLPPGKRKMKKSFLVCPSCFVMCCEID
jgi:serine/threonine protein phosphatase PrpC